jgi:hypothetical protein
VRSCAATAQLRLPRYLNQFNQPSLLRWLKWLPPLVPVQIVVSPLKTIGKPVPIAGTH